MEPGRVSKVRNRGVILVVAILVVVVVGMAPLVLGREMPENEATTEEVETEDGTTVELTDVLLLADGENVTVGAPVVAGAKVVARVLGTQKGRKIHGFTYKPTKRIQRHYGHRQWGTTLRVESIQA